MQRSNLGVTSPQEFDDFNKLLEILGTLEAVPILLQKPLKYVYLVCMTPPICYECEGEIDWMDLVIKDTEFM